MHREARFMRSSRFVPTAVVAALLTLFLGACFGDGDETMFEPNQTISYDLEPADVTMLEGSTATLQVMKETCETDTATLNRTCITEDATSCCELWLSSSPAVAGVTPGTGGAATVTALTEGDAEIIGHVTIINGVPTTSVRAMVHVWPTNMQLVVLAPSLPVLTGSAVPLVAELRRSNGTVFPGGSFTWQTSDPSVAAVQVDAANSHQATLTAVAPGTVTITAMEGTFNLSGNAPATVTSLIVTISPSNPSVVLGGTRDLTASAQLADGTPVPVAFVWSSSDPGVASVAPDPTSSDKATVTAVAQGTAVIRARETTEGARDSTFVTVIPLVTNTFIEGTARAVDGTLLPGLVVRISHTVTGAAYRSTTDALGEYRVGVGTGGAYNIFVQGVANFSYNQTEGDVIQVVQGQTATFDPDLTQGYHLAITGGRGDRMVAPGQSLQIFLNYTTWNRSGAALATIHIVAGVDGNPAPAFRVGVPGPYPPGASGTAAFTLTAPGQTGDYGIYALLANSNTAADSESRYAGGFPNTELFIRVGTLMVR